MAPLKPTGFWSYTSADDAASDGRLSRLRRQLANRLQQQLGRPVHLFQDVAAIPPGTSWEQQIEGALTEASFFVPILTPGFLQSEWCAKEVRRFRAHMESQGRNDLILPVHYLDVSGFATVRRGDCFDPEVFDYLRSLQWVDFRALEPLDADTTDVRVWLAAFARRVEEALYREVPPPLESVKPPPAMETVPKTVPAEDTLPPSELPVPEAASPPLPVQSKPAAPVSEPPPAPVADRRPSRQADRPSTDTRPEPPTIPSVSVPVWRKPALWGAAGIAVLMIGFFSIVPKMPTSDAPGSPIVAAQPTPAVAPPPKPMSEPAASPAKVLRDTCPANVICPEMVLIPHGSFQMGTTDEELVREKVPEQYRSREQPRHPVTIGTDFYIGKYVVTLGEFKAFVRAKGARPGGGCYTLEKSADGSYWWQLKLDRSWENPGFPQTDRDPVVCVSYVDAVAYIDWLNGETGTKSYRLPSEAEWEYAARAGTVTARFWGDGRTQACRFANVADQTLAKQMNVGSPDPDRYFACSDGFAYTAPVGSFQPNGFGLYDMLGNVWQWTADCWRPDYKGAPATGLVNTTGDCSLRVLRGASWGYNPWIVRSGHRSWFVAGSRSTDVGFRLARTL